jgi:hypothetical protein
MMSRNGVCDNSGLPPLFPCKKNTPTLWKDQMRIAGSRLESTDGQEVKPRSSIEYRSANQRVLDFSIVRCDLDAIYCFVGEKELLLFTFVPTTYVEAC